MPITYDNQRSKYIVRLTHNGKRIYVGRYTSKKVAEAALFSAEKRVKSLDKVSLANCGAYEPKYVETDKSLIQRIVASYRKRKAERELDKETRKKLEAM